MPVPWRHALIVLILLIEAVQADHTAVEVERAKYLEETLEDFEGAIAIYKRIADDDTLPVRWRAIATFGLGRCYDKQGSYVAANRYYLGVVKEFGEFSVLADRASDEILANSRILAEGGGAVGEDDHLYLGDLIRVLDAAVRNDEYALAREACQELSQMLDGLEGEVEGHADEETFAQMKEETETVKELLAKRDKQGVRHLLREGEGLSYYLDGVLVEDPGEVFSSPLRWMDQLSRALAANDSQKATRLCRQIASYLQPLTELPESDERKYAVSLITAARSVEEQLVRTDLAGARRVLFETARVRAKEDNAMAVYMEGFEDMPSSWLPHLCVMATWIEEALEVMKGEPGKAKEMLSKASEALAVIENMADGKMEKEVAGEIRTDLKSALEALEEGRTEEVQRILAPEE